MGLQSKTIDDLEKELELPASQLLALYNKAIRRMVASLRAVLDEEVGSSLPQVADAEAATAHMAPLADDLRDELDDGAKASLKAMQEKTAKRQESWLADDSELSRYAIKGSDADWESALEGKAKGGATPKALSLKGEKRDYTPASKEEKKKKDKGSAGAKRKRPKD